MIQVGAVRPKAQHLTHRLPLCPVVTPRRAAGRRGVTPTPGLQPLGGRGPEWAKGTVLTEKLFTSHTPQSNKTWFGLGRSLDQRILPSCSSRSRPGGQDAGTPESPGGGGSPVLCPGRLGGAAGQVYLVLEIFFQSRVLRWLSTSEWCASTWLASPLSVVHVRSCSPSSSRRSAGAPGSR